MKLKTVKSAKKRIVKITKNGKIIQRKLSAQHLTAGKSKRTLRNKRKTAVMSDANVKNIKKLVPYA